MSENDNINMEFEARVMLDEIQYNKIRDYYISHYSNYREIVNENSYFDTPDLYLTKHHTVLRTRTINGENKELTLKIQLDDYCLEINHELTSNEEKALFENGEITNERILEKLSEYEIDISSIRLITTLKTERIEIEFPDYLFVIDKNYYREKVDYNLEVESTSELLAETYLKEIIAPYGVTYKKDYISKSKRAIYNL